MGIGDDHYEGSDTMDNDSFNESGLVVDEVKDQWDIIETPITGIPKKGRLVYDG